MDPSSSTPDQGSSSRDSNSQQDLPPLGQERILSKILTFLPEQKVLKSDSDLVASIIHAAFLNLGFRFIGIGETQSSSENDPQGQGLLPPNWNATGDSYSFRYRHDQSSFTFLVKSVKLASKLVVHGLAVEDGSLHDLQVDLSSLLPRSTSWPLVPTSLDSLSSALESKERFDEFVYQLKIKIIQKLIPGLNKPGYEEATTTSQAPPRENPNPRRDPRPMFPTGPMPSRPFVSGIPSRPVFGVGDVDLDPFAAAPGLIVPPRGMHPGGGMVVGPDHPMFGGGPSFPQHPGLGGMPRLPPGAVPPGARFDPISPFGPAPSGGFGRGRGGLGRGSNAPFSGDPDFDELLPPGNNDDMFM